MKPGAPGRIRTRDPLLRRHLPGVAGGRLESFYMAISCIDRGWAWLEVALELSPLAPFLAPPISLPSLIPESAKGSLTGQSRLHTARRGHTGAAPAGTERLSPRHLPMDAAVHHHLMVNLIIR